jgi:hypothetical protein
MKKAIPTITLIIISFALILAYTNSGLMAYAQNQSSSNASLTGTNQTSQNQTSAAITGQAETNLINQTSAAITGQAETNLINQTTVPAKQTTVTVNQTTNPVKGQDQLQPLENQTIQQQTPKLTGFENKTMVQATGPATTSIVNQTTVPYNQTTIETGNYTNSQQPQQQQNQTGPSQQQNQSKGPLEQLGESVGNLIGGNK